MNEQLLSLYSEGNFDAMAEVLGDFAPKDLAIVLNEIRENDLVTLCSKLEHGAVADALVELPPEKQRVLLENLNDFNLKEVMDEVSVEDTVDIIEDMPPVVVMRFAEEEELLTLVEKDNYKVLKPLLSEMPPVDVASILGEIEQSKIPLVFRILPKSLAADVFVEMDAESQKFLVEKLSDVELKAVMDDLFVDDTVDIIEEMPANVVKRMLAQSNKELRDGINQILQYERNSAGSIMTVEFVRVRENMTVKEAFDSIRKTGIDKETIYTCYVTDNRKKLIGIVTAKDLLLAPQTAVLSDIMTENVIYAHTGDDKEEVANTINKYGFLALPVVDNEDRLVGIVTVDDAMDVMQQANTEDIEKTHAMLPSDKPYLKTSLWEIFLNRLPWLVILMLSATFTALILNAYESTLNGLGNGIVGGLLIACVPMLMGTGGNAGSQASVTVIRGLALSEIRFKDIFRIQRKELLVSLLLAISLGVICFVKLLLIDNLVFGYDYTVTVSLVISLSLAITVIAAKLVGCTLPLIAKVLRLDPAIVASPFITTVIDVLSLIVYCNVAIALLG